MSLIIHWPYLWEDPVSNFFEFYRIQKTGFIHIIFYLIVNIFLQQTCLTHLYLHGLAFHHQFLT